MEIFHDTFYVLLCAILLIWNQTHQWSNAMVGIVYFFITPLGLLAYGTMRLIMAKTGKFARDKPQISKYSYRL